MKPRSASAYFDDVRGLPIKVAALPVWAKAGFMRGHGTNTEDFRMTTNCAFVAPDGRPCVLPEGHERIHRVTPIRQPHHCHAEGCGVAVPPAMWGCRKHWFMVPKPLRDEIWRLYVPGQEVRKDPTDEYIDASRAAVEAVAKKEGLR